MVDILDPTKVGGTDLSSYDTSPDVSTGTGINWNTMLKAGIKFLYTRASIGLNTDGAFSKIWSESKGLLPRGGYHFLYPSSTGLSIRQQANLFASLLKSDPGELPPCVDVEYQGTDSKNRPAVLTSSDVFGFITYLHEAFDPWPWKDDVLIYTGYYYWKDTIASTDSFASLVCSAPGLLGFHLLVPIGVLMLRSLHSDSVGCLQQRLFLFPMMLRHLSSQVSQS